MKKILTVVLIILIISAGTAFCGPADQIILPDGLKVGKTRSEVRMIAGLPLQMKGDTWKYRDYVVIFESNAVKCIIKSSCFGKWTNCHSFKLRSPECLIISE